MLRAQIVLVLAALLGVVTPASAQGRQQKGTTLLRLDAVDTARSNVGEFVFFASFIDRYFKAISVPDAAAWTVNIDGNDAEGELSIKPLRDSKYGVTAVVVLAGYNAIDDEVFNYARKGAVGLLNRLREQDRSAVVVYGRSVEASGPVGANHAEAVGWLNERKVDGVVVYLNDSIEKALELFPVDYGTVSTNRALVVVSDGYDELDERPAKLRQRLQQLKEMAQDRNVRINVVGIALEDDREGLKNLKHMAGYLGGTYRVAETPPKVERHLEDLTRELLEQHVLVFKTTDFDDDKEVAFKLAVQHGGRTHDSDAVLALVAERESHLFSLILTILGGILGAVLLFFLGRFALRALRNRGGHEEVDEGPEVVHCRGCNNQIPITWKACQYCEALPHFGRLTVRSLGDLNGNIYFIREALTNLGSAEGNHIILIDASVSKRHAGVKVQDNRFELADYGSTNGVLVNGTRITKQFLRDGDLIGIGALELEFTLKK